MQKKNSKNLTTKMLIAMVAAVICGIGVIAGAMVGMRETDVASNPIEANTRALRREIEKARELTSGIIGKRAVYFAFASETAGPVASFDRFTFD